MWGQHSSVGVKHEHPRLFGVLKVLEEGIFTPCDSLVHVGSGIRVSLALSSLATEKPTNVAVSHNPVKYTIKQRTREG